MTKPGSLDRAKDDAYNARAQLAATLSELQERFNPRVLLHEAWADLRERGDQAAEDAIELARSRPGATAGVAAAIAVVLLRHPLSRAVTRLFLSKDETENADDKFEAKRSTPAAPRRRRAATAAKGD